MSVSIEKPIVLDLIPSKSPALSSTSDMPVIETKPDSTPKESVKDDKEVKPDPKPEPKATAEKEVAAAPAKEVEGKTKTEDAPADDLEQPESTSASDLQAKKPAKGVQKRLDELTRQAREAERLAEAERQEKLRLLSLLESKDKKPEPVDLVRPKREEFPTQEAYEDAFIAYSDERSRRAASAELEAKQKADKEAKDKADIAAEAERVQKAYATRVEKFKEAHPDYSDVAESPDVQISIPMAHAIAHSEHGPELAYFLGSKPEEASRISALNPTAQLIELGLIVAALKAPPSKPVSAAPPPPKPLKSGSDTTPKIDPEEESMEAYAARRKKELAKEGRPGVRH